MENTTKPKPSLPGIRLSPQVAKILRDRKKFFRQLEIDGCPAAVVSELRGLTQIALAQTLAESKRRAFLLCAIKRNVQKLKLKRGCSDFPSDTPETLDQVERFASQLRDEGEKRIMLRGVERLRKSYSALAVDGVPEGCGR